MPEARSSDVVVVPLGPQFKREWERLFVAYGSFYTMSLSQATTDIVWQWLMDDAHVTNGKIAICGGSARGIVHYRDYPRSLSGTTAGFLDDLYVEPASRGLGIGRMLIESVQAEGEIRGWSFIRWMTAPENGAARALYDRCAALTPWVTYQIDVHDRLQSD